MTESSDPQIQLKKRARRRLVGAIAFAGLAAVVLPMVMDDEPRQHVQDVQVRIPGQDQTPFRPKEPPAKPVPTAEVASPNTPRPEVAVPVVELPSVKPAVVANTKPAVTKTADKGPERSTEKKVTKPVEKTSDAGAEKKLAKPADKTAETKPTVKKAEKAVDKSTDKAVARSAEKPASETPRALAKPPEKPVDKPAVEPSSDRAPEKPVDKPAEESKPVTDEPQRTGSSASAASKPAAAVTSPAKSTATQHVILVGAFANSDNVKQLQGKLGGLGVSSYTEVLTQPDGTKIRVRAGPFPSREAAEKALEKLKRSGVNGVVASRQ